MEQTKKLVNEVDRNTGRMSSFYEKSDARLTYNIPFTKENVDKYLMSEHPFGPDSIISQIQIRSSIMASLSI